MADKLIRATAVDGGIRAVGVITTRLTEEARQRHKLSSLATAALGRTMSAGLLLASSLKKPGSRINIRIKGDGPLGGVLVDAGLDGTVRGYVDYPQVELPPKANGKLDVGRGIGNKGFVRVLREEKGEEKNELQESTVELVSGEIGEDVNYFLYQSEQTPSALQVGVFVSTSTGVTASGGILLQVLSKEAARDEVLVARLESRVNKLATFSKLLRAGKGLEDIFQELLGDMGLEIFPAVQMLRFNCDCSFDRVLGALRYFGVDELKDMIEKDKQAEATCHFCGEVYNASEAQLIELVESLQAESC
jgi:molecular chaperone Hsp33